MENRIEEEKLLKGVLVVRLKEVMKVFMIGIQERCYQDLLKGLSMS
jgi:hypothetical protein